MYGPIDVQEASRTVRAARACALASHESVHHYRSSAASDRSAQQPEAMPSLLSDANLRFVGDPKPSCQWFSTEQRNKASQDRERRLPALVPESQHDDALVLRWWICTNIGEIQIQGNECTSFMSADANDFLVTSSAQALLVDRYGVVTVAPQ